MTNEEKQLLLKDLCARLPYGVKVDVNFYYATKELSCNLLQDIITDEKSLRPYLRPMSSMTDEETDRMWEIYESGLAVESSVAVTEYLYERGLDCHHLIEKGLALEAPEGMYKTE